MINRTHPQPPETFSVDSEVSFDDFVAELEVAGGSDERHRGHCGPPW